MTDAQTASKIRSNEHVLRTKATEVAEVMRAAYGIVGTPDADAVWRDIAVGLQALDTYSDVETTHGRVCVRRHPTDPHSFQVLLNLGTVDLFTVDA